ncbi:6-carboxyhexanoate--CoA ligase [Peptoniphilus asaccharolyticus]
MLYSVKMRASKLENGKEIHISGAERIVEEGNLDEVLLNLKKRAFKHERGNIDNINIKIERMENDEILNLKLLKSKQVNVKDYNEGFDFVKKFIENKGIDDSERVLSLLKSINNMRGAIILNVETLERMESDLDRGVRVTYMDYKSYTNRACDKNHFLEAIVLATKVANAPGIVGEICISDDPNYIKGYVSSKEDGYIRISKLKEEGDIRGGRIFLYDPKICRVENTINFLENKKVLVHE